MSTFTLAYRRNDMLAAVQIEFDHAARDWADVANFVSARQFPNVPVKAPLWLDVKLAKQPRETA